MISSIDEKAMNAALTSTSSPQTEPAMMIADEEGWEC
jgi:hypothetical protein